jgi:hypothetical protein
MSKLGSELSPRLPKVARENQKRYRLLGNMGLMATGLTFVITSRSLPTGIIVLGLFLMAALFVSLLAILVKCASEKKQAIALARQNDFCNCLECNCSLDKESTSAKCPNCGCSYDLKNVIQRWKAYSI